MRNYLVAVAILGFLSSSNALSQNIDYSLLKEEWQKRCNTDTMTDQTTCTVMFIKWVGEKKNKHLTVGGSHEIIIVGQEDLYPNRPVYLRVDKNKPYESSSYADDMTYFFPEKAHKGLIEEMKNGHTLLIRYTEWPSAFSQEVTIPLHGFKDAYEQTFGVAK
jgi:hypothetical protein